MYLCVVRVNSIIIQSTVCGDGGKISSVPKKQSSLTLLSKCLSVYLSIPFQKSSSDISEKYRQSIDLIGFENFLPTLTRDCQQTTIFVCVEWNNFFCFAFGSNFYPPCFSKKKTKNFQFLPKVMVVVISVPMIVYSLH